jgi:hypothetical protein
LDKDELLIRLVVFGEKKPPGQEEYLIRKKGHSGRKNTLNGQISMSI